MIKALREQGLVVGMAVTQTHSHSKGVIYSPRLAGVWCGCGFERAGAPLLC